VFWLDVRDIPSACILRRSGEPRWARLPGSGKAGQWSAEDAHLAHRVHDTLRQPTGGRGGNRLIQQLRRQRLAPLQKHLEAQDGLPAVRRLVVVPTGLMARVPVEVLAPDWTVSYAPSATLFARSSQRHRAVSGQSLLALGNPQFQPPPLPLPRPPKTGVLIKVVLPGGVAARAGLRPGDVVLRYDGQALERPEDLQPNQARPVKVLCWREGREVSLRLNPGPPGVVFDQRSAPAAVRAWRRAGATPGQRGSGHAPLPGTLFEVQALARLLGEKQTTLLTGSLASEQELERLARAGSLKRFRLIHLATHGEIDWRAPRRSALILAQDRLPDPVEQARHRRTVYDGRLRVAAILEGWDLDADLVVLSACQTGLGKEAGGEGLLGFAQAFLQKGARSVVLSRWKVDDTATALLMVRFYENLLGKRTGLKQGMKRAAALVEAKKWLAGLKREQAGQLAQRLASGVLRGTEKEARPLVKGKLALLPEGERPFAHPYFWAAFFLLGDPE
jgi:hypothetical protein